MSDSYTISRLTKSDKDFFVSLISRAFARDPLFLHLFGDSTLNSEARRRVAAFVSFLFDKSLMLHEEVWGYWEGERLSGAYIVEKPNASKRQIMRSALLMTARLVPLLFQLSGKTLRRLNSYMRATRAAAPPLTHHYLIMIGVQPEEQGKGIGKALLHHLLSMAVEDKESHGVALDTESENNADMYRRFGFSLSKKTQIDTLPVYCMFFEKSF